MARTSNRQSAPSGSATIRDVAARAGVSVATVSRVFNRIGPMRPETMLKVRQAAEELQYVPHAGARSLSIRSTHTFGVLLPDLHGEFFSEVIRGIDVAARQAGFHILVSGSHSDSEEMSQMLRALRGRVDGLVVMSPDLQLGSITKALPADTPVVLLNTAANAWPTIRIDNYSGARAMTSHLLSLGHRTVAFITGPERNADAADRMRGYRETVDEAGLPRVIVDGDFTEDSGYAAVPAILARNPRPTAIFAANDAMAIGALRALREARVRVPEEMALAGFDDVPIARYLTPPLTTVSVDIAELGRRAVDHLVCMLDNSAGGGTRHDVIPTALVKRESCGRALPDRRTETPQER